MEKRTLDPQGEDKHKRGAKEMVKVGNSNDKISRQEDKRLRCEQVTSIKQCITKEVPRKGLSQHACEQKPNEQTNLTNRPSSKPRTNKQTRPNCQQQHSSNNRQPGKKPARNNH